MLFDSWRQMRLNVTCGLPVTTAVQTDRKGRRPAANGPDTNIGSAPASDTAQTEPGQDGRNQTETGQDGRNQTDPGQDGRNQTDPGQDGRNQTSASDLVTEARHLPRAGQRVRTYVKDFPIEARHATRTDYRSY